MDEQIYDLIGIGIGPYNLGLAALADQTHDIDAIFFERTPEFIWHPGMLIEKMDLQVPFLADLATFADPKSPYTFMNYLYEHDRMFPFFFHRHFEVPRQEYNDYMQWVANQLDSLYFGHTVLDVIDKKDAEHPHYEVIVEEKATGERKYVKSKHVVLGTGNEPLVLDGMEDLPNEDVLHTSRYLFEKQNLLKAKHVTVVGSGQSAVEVFLDLLEEQERQDMKLTLLTRSGGLFSLDKAKFAQEAFTPSYVDYFHNLSFEQREQTLDTLKPLRNGIDPQTLTQLYTKLYHRTAGQRDSRVLIQPMTEVQGIEAVQDGYELSCKQWQEDVDYTYHSEKVVLALGYKPHIPSWFMNRYKNAIEWEGENVFKVTRDYQLVFNDNRDHHFFTLTNLVHSHGAGATNLGLSVHRNVHIINTIAGRTVYKNQRDTTFQQFSMKDFES
ncbi:lysine N(6)-hydroxylase/L-ornithine N(5)-oxygenase family protein [Halobacillus halophilus]|uniref:lysine N(6)-hydroxylase/L-ornithine N(5)-oxygenase family protein n=1 Tax=Halobacillus halophilus TaxID=1570 RepID=UPI001CD27F50|nr:SidA/IucD/PvdA family monooxygenase [Halobacillus halophilus]MCA1011875.1 SidA/IucD/PvdA family monooxygenase [Halobacillus halophilus]